MVATLGCVCSPLLAQEPLAIQSPRSPFRPVRTSLLELGPRPGWSIDSLATSPAPTAALAAKSGTRGDAVALMLVGGAGLLSGLITDQDLLTVIGAGVAGVGLYLYVR
jgi:hypothetical protein